MQHTVHFDKHMFRLHISTVQLTLLEFALHKDSENHTQKIEGLCFDK